MLLAYRVSEANRPVITVHNGGVAPQIEDEPTYFIHDSAGYNSIVTDEEFAEKYNIIYVISLDCEVYRIEEN